MKTAFFNVAHDWSTPFLKLQDDGGRHAGKKTSQYFRND